MGSGAKSRLPARESWCLVFTGDVIKPGRPPHGVRHLVSAALLRLYPKRTRWGGESQRCCLFGWRPACVHRRVDAGKVFAKGGPRRARRLRVDSSSYLGVASEATVYSGGRRAPSSEGRGTGEEARVSGKVGAERGATQDRGEGPPSDDVLNARCCAHAVLAGALQP